MSARNSSDSFGEFTGANIPEPPVIDLRGVEAKLNSGRAHEAASDRSDSQSATWNTNDTWPAAIGRTLSSLVAVPSSLMQGSRDNYDNKPPQEHPRKISEQHRREPTLTNDPIPVTLSVRRDDTDPVLDEWYASRLHTIIPRRLRLRRNWRLVYSLDQHGSSLSTLYSRVTGSKENRKGAAKEQWLLGSSQAAQNAVMGTSSRSSTTTAADSGFIIAINDMQGNIFGAYVNEQLRPHQHYYGNGECFLWKTVNNPGKNLEVFRWTGKNAYMILTESSFLSVGGGDGKYGLWIDSSLSNGLSAWCPAYDNTILCDNVPYTKHTDDSCARKFQCMGVEVWAIGD